MQKIKIGIIGIGMVGTPLMDWFLEKGWSRGKNLFCFDKDITKDCSDNMLKAQVVFVCVPTPPNLDGSCNTSIVEDAVRQLPDGKRAIVVKSTVSSGTVASLAKRYKKKGYFLFNPEFLTEKQATEDFRNPTLQIVAPANKKARPWAGVVLDLLPKAYFQSPLQSENTYSFYGLNSSEAEETKYAINLFGAMKVTFFVILYLRCKIQGLNFKNVWRMVTKDPRIGDSWSWAPHGKILGYNGFCFPKDTNAFIFHSKQLAQKISKGPERTVFSLGVKFFETMKNFNERLHISQGTTVKEMSVHDSERERKIDEKGEKND